MYSNTIPHYVNHQDEKETLPMSDRELFEREAEALRNKQRQDNIAGNNIAVEERRSKEVRSKDIVRKRSERIRRAGNPASAQDQRNKDAERKRVSRSQTGGQERREKDAERKRLQRAEKRLNGSQNGPNTTGGQEEREKDAERKRLQRAEKRLNGSQNAPNTTGGKEQREKDAERKRLQRAEKRLNGSQNASNTTGGQERREKDAERKQLQRAEKRLNGSQNSQNTTDVQEQRQKDAERKRQKRAENRKNELADDDRKRSQAWRLINQFQHPQNVEEKEAVENVSCEYKEDLEEFRKEISSPLTNKVCGVCGIRKKPHQIIHENSNKFNCLRAIPYPFDTIGAVNWWRFSSPEWDKEETQNVVVCEVCYRSIAKDKVPLMSRACYPIGLKQLPPFLTELSELEQALISPVLPMIFIYQHHGSNGQYKSFGQSIALQNDVEAIAKVLPRKPAEICMKLSTKRGVMQNVRPHYIRQAIEYFRSNGHPGFTDIKFSEENFELLCSTVDNDQNLNVDEEVNDASNTETGQENVEQERADCTAADRLLHRGQNQSVEEETATACENIPVGAEPLHYTQVLRDATLDILSKTSRKQIFRSHVTENWHLKFPLLLPEGTGGPNDCTDEKRKLSLENWIKYVIQVEELHFSSNVLFILYANNVTRRRKITGFACNKSISLAVRDAVKELTELVHNNNSNDSSPQHKAAVEALLTKVSYHTNDVTGSVQDKSTHRQNILSMYNDSRHGAPQLFVTLSAAESFWPETFVFISNGKLSLEEAKNLTSAQRAELIAKNPVRVTIAWKERVAAFINLITKGKSKPFGNVLHYIWTAEWQTRLSEHIHILIWCDSNFSEMVKTIDGDGNVRLGDNSPLIKEIEKFVCMQIPEIPCTDPLAQRPTTHEAITQEPIEFFQYLFDINKSIETKSQLRNLVHACNIHRCNNYCTRNGTCSCKSNFPHRLRTEGEIVETIDAKQNTYYRAQLKRNDTQVNNYSVPVINAWRANMDITALLGDAFGACVYVAYYTSKKDKSADLNKIINKVKNMEIANTDDELKRNLTRVLLAIDSCKATGAPEAASNLLGYKHHYTSTQIDRIFHREFMNEAENLERDNHNNLSPSSSDSSNESDEDEIENSIQVMNRQMADLAQGHPLFEFTVNESYERNSDQVSEDRAASSHHRLTQLYMSRPSALEHLSHQCYHELYTVSPKSRNPDKFKLKSGQLLDMKNRLVDLRPNKIGWYVILDLKYRPPPDTDNEQWCAGALALHATYRCTRDILRPHGVTCLENNVSFCAAYKFWAELEQATGILKFPKLKMYETNMKTLQATNNNVGRPRGRRNSQMNKDDRNSDADYENCDDDDDDDAMDLEDIENDMHSTIPIYNTKKSWSGLPSMKHAVVGTHPQTDAQICTQSHSSLLSSINDSKMHTGLIYNKKLPPEPTQPLQEHTDFRAAISNGADRRDIANRFKLTIKSKCKTATQEHAFETATKSLENYFFQPNSSQMMILTGVAGAGKSFVSDKFATFASLLLGDNDHPYDSPQAVLQREAETGLTTTFAKSVANIGISDDVQNPQTCKIVKNRVRTLAYSGAAAGVAKGYTIHHALKFSKQLSADVLHGILDLPLLKNNESLESFWENRYVLTLDEFYFCDAAFINLISQRLCQIRKRYDKPFGGLFVLFLGDPQQIKAISGEPLYKYNYYYPAPGNSPEFLAAKKERRIKELSSSPGARKGFEIYGSCKIYCHMPESIRLADEKYQALTQRAASYELTDSDIVELNRYVRTKKELYSEQWLSAIWILPTWEEINRHHEIVTSFMAKTRSVLRVWSRPTINTANVSPDRARKVLHTYYSKTSTEIGRDFTEPLPYLDLFPGQILCLKDNFIPSLGFYKNARVVVVGVQYHDESRTPSHVASIDEAIEQAMHADGPPAYDVLVRFYNEDAHTEYKGVSALSATPGVFTLPWKSVQKKIGNTSITVQGLHAHPGNAGTGHGSQGATFLAAVAAITPTTKRWYGWGNVVISRTKASNFALRYPVTKDTMQPQMGQSAIVRNELNRLSYYATPRDVIERNWKRPVTV